MLWVRICIVILALFTLTNSHGLMLPYTPAEVSNDCAFSYALRYDLSYGMGLSDTITLVLRTLTESDYECTLEIVTEDSYFLLLVLKYPTPFQENCLVNRDIITFFRKNLCIRVCDILTNKKDGDTYFFSMTARERIRFRFLSNSSLSNDFNSNIYQITATSARKAPLHGCNTMNESKCIMPDGTYCYTNGVVCDGIKNCAQANWFDERKLQCGLTVHTLGFMPVIAVIAAIMCAMLAIGHLLYRCMPPLAQSFFIFNTNEDNRLCIDPVFQPPKISDIDEFKSTMASVIQVPSISSDDSSLSQDNDQSRNVEEEIQTMFSTFAAENSI